MDFGMFAIGCECRTSFCRDLVIVRLARNQVHSIPSLNLDLEISTKHHRSGHQTSPYTYSEKPQAFVSVGRLYAGPASPLWGSPHSLR